MNTFFRTLAVSTALAFTAGCTSDNTGEMQAEKQPQATGYTKPGASVEFNHNYDGKTEPGEVERFQVFFRKSNSGDTLSVNVRQDERLEYFSGKMRESAALGDESDTALDQVMDVQLSSQATGKYYLSFEAKTEDPSGQVLLRPYKIGIQIGDPVNNPKPKNAPMIEETESGEKIIIMEAEEEINR